MTAESGYRPPLEPALCRMWDVHLHLSRKENLFRRTFIPSAECAGAGRRIRSVDVQQTTTMNGVVETVDPVSRELLLEVKGPIRRCQHDCCWSPVRDQVKSGDRVAVTSIRHSRLGW